MRYLPGFIFLTFTLCACGQPSTLLNDEPDIDTMDMSADFGQDLAQDLPKDQTTRPPPSCTSPEVACGQLCVNLQADPTNCGACGRTCVLPHAQATCNAGECAVALCEAGFYNEDKDFKNGCESQTTQTQCKDGEACMTMCNSTGTTKCMDNKPTCMIPAETCNGVDDDCDGQCDTGLAGCRQGIHRGRGMGHIYSTQASDIPTIEAMNYFYLYKDTPQGNGSAAFQPVFLCTKADGTKFLTQSTNCEINRAPDKKIGHWATSETCGAIPLYRLYLSSSNNHFYTTNATERDNAVNNLGYKFERIAGYVWPR